MPVFFTVHAEQNYFQSKYVGKLTDSEVLAAVKAFYEGTEWRPGLNELADFSQADVTLTTSRSLKTLADLMTSYLQQHGVEHCKLAIYTPNLLIYGLARIFSAWMDESPVKINIFKDIDKARQWLGIA